MSSWGADWIHDTNGFQAEKKAVFYELDLPQVIRLREKLLPPEENQTYISSSMLESEWMAMLATKHPDGSFIFVIEGVLMHFPKDKVKTVICNLARRFPSLELHFDSMSKWMSRHSHRHDTVKHVNAKFIWGMNDEKEVESWSSNIKHRETLYYMNLEKSAGG